MPKKLPKSTLRWTAASVFAVGGAINGCDCDPEVDAIAPQIYVDACATPERTVDGVLIGGYEDCLVDFGAKDISVKSTRELKVTNPSRIALTFKDVVITGDPAFKLELKPDVIEAGLSGIIVVSARPMLEAKVDGVLHIKSDANNGPQTDDHFSLVEIPLKVEGVDNGIPDIEVDPEECDFGRVPNSGVGTCTLHIKNVGNKGLVLDAAEFIPPEGAGAGQLFAVPNDSAAGGHDGLCDVSSGDLCAFAFNGRPPSPDEEIAPDGESVVQVRLAPDVLGNYRGTLRLLTNDPDEQEVIIPLSGLAVPPPTCHIAIKSVNGVPVGDTVPQIEPLDDVILTLEGSTPSTPDQVISGYEFSIGARPTSSTVQLTTPTDVTTGFTFDDDLGVDLVGSYTVRAAVKEGTVSSVNECELTFDAIPKDHFLVQLSWDTVGDLDLHVAKESPSGQFCFESNGGGNVTGFLGSECDNGLDCRWNTCKQGSAGSPEWDGAPGRSEGDPALDIDDIDGLGPENINVDVMPEGRYLIAVSPYGVSTSIGVVVRLFIFGRLRGEFYYDGLSSGGWFEVARVDWPADLTVQPCVEDLTDGSDTDQCG